MTGGRQGLREKGSSNCVADFLDFFGRRTEWMFGRTPAAAGDGDAREELVELLVVADGEGDVPGMMRDFLLSRAALPASSRTSAAMYSRTAAR